MIDLVCAFSTCGLVLWSRRLTHEADDVLYEFVERVLLGDHAGQERFQSGDHIVKYVLANDHDLVFVAVYLNITNLFYVDALLEGIRNKFLSLYDTLDFPKTADTDFIGFNPVYDKLLARHESGAAKLHQRSIPRPSSAASKDRTQPDTAAASDAIPESEVHSTSDKDEDDDEAAGNTMEGASNNVTADIRAATLERLKSRRRGQGGSAKSKAPATKPKAAAQPKKVTKRSWNITPKHVDVEQLDHTAPKGLDTDEPDAERVELPSSGDDSGYDTSDVEIGDTTRSSGIFSYFQGLIGKKLERGDILPALEAIKTNLTSKNVATDIADSICDSVCATLVGKNLSSLQIRSAVHRSIEETLLRVLAPSSDTDILRRIHQVNDIEKRPFSIVFVGVNGVGKSTSLSKICYYLLSKKLVVSMIACDTFRAGAVEQLNTHAKRLNVEVFQKGYNRDPSSVAMDGLENAKRQKHNVVLIDTAGRMQDNEPLMRALAKLIDQTRPDLVLFVGEALVGNDGVDQLTKFNQALSDFSTDSNPRHIDGIVLTKFDTIDDKVGAAISMTYTANIPIMFVGVGQDYRDMRRMNIKSVIKKLLR